MLRAEAETEIEDSKQTPPACGKAVSDRMGMKLSSARQMRFEAIGGKSLRKAVGVGEAVVT